MKNLSFLLIILVASLANTASSVDSVQWVCIGGKDPSKLSKKDYLTEFGKGPCSPVILLPGIGGSNMNIMIDCEKLRDSNPSLFKECDWNACDSDTDSTIAPENKSIPKKEYLAWVPHIDSPMTVFSPLEKNKNCFAGLMKLEYDDSGPVIKTKKIPGIDVKIVGTTPETRSKDTWDCGMDGVLDIIPDIPEPHELTYFKNTYKKLLEMGYISGLTAQGVPYDFRMDNKNDPIYKNYLPLVKEMYSMINKKVVLLSHSMGSYRTYTLLNEMTQEDKDKYIRQYIAAAPVLVGASQVSKYFWCGTKEYFFPFHLGIDFKTFKKTLGDYTSMYQLLPNDYRTLNKDEDWMKKIQARVAYEKGESEDPVFDWMPKRDEVCFEKYPDRKYCISGLQRPDTYGQFMGQNITDTNFRELISNYTFASLKGDGFKVIDDNFRKLPNINVPTTIFYSTRVKAEGGHNIKEDPRQFTIDKVEFCPKKSFDILWEYGDGTVPQHASVTPWIKWAYEFEQKKPNAKPVKFVEVCSGKNQRMTPFDGKNEKGENILKTVEYQGLECNCKQGRVKDCDHVGMIILNTFNDYIATALQVEEHSELSPKVQAMSESDLENYVNQCNMIYLTYNRDSPETESMRRKREESSKVRVEYE